MDEVINVPTALRKFSSPGGKSAGIYVQMTGMGPDPDNGFAVNGDYRAEGPFVLLGDECYYAYGYYLPEANIPEEYRGLPSTGDQSGYFGIGTKDIRMEPLGWPHQFPATSLAINGTNLYALASNRQLWNLNTLDPLNTWKSVSLEISPKIFELFETVGIAIHQDAGTENYRISKFNLENDQAGPIVELSFDKSAAPGFLLDAIMIISALDGSEIYMSDGKSLYKGLVVDSTLVVSLVTVLSITPISAIRPVKVEMKHGAREGRTAATEAKHGAGEPRTAVYFYAIGNNGTEGPRGYFIQPFEYTDDKTNPTWVAIPSFGNGGSRPTPPTDLRILPDGRVCFWIAASEAHICNPCTAFYLSRKTAGGVGVFVLPKPYVLLSDAYPIDLNFFADSSLTNPFPVQGNASNTIRLACRPSIGKYFDLDFWSPQIGLVPIKALNLDGPGLRIDLALGPDGGVVVGEIIIDP